MVINFTPVIRHRYRIGLSREGAWSERLNTDAAEYGGSGVGNLGQVRAQASPWQGRPYSAALTLPPLAALVLTPAT